MDRTARNQMLIRQLYTGRATRPAWTFLAAEPDLAGTSDYTVSQRPIADFVMPRVRQYEAGVRLVDAVESDTVPLASLATGTQLFAHAFGCGVHTFADNNPCALPMIATPEEAMRLNAPRVEDCPNLMRVFELAELLERELGPEAPLRICDMQTGFDIANLIWNKSDLLCAMITDPEAVKHLTGACSRLLGDFVARLKREFPQVSPCHCPGNWVPPEFGIWVSNDECGAIGPEMFAEFCLPELCALSERFSGLGMHCCADAEHQFEQFRNIPYFYGFNRVPSKHGCRPMVDILGGADGPVFTQAWMDVASIGELLRYDDGKSRWHFVFLNSTPESARRIREEIDFLPASLSR